MAAAFVSPMIDALVTPESLALMMKGETPAPGSTSPARDSRSAELDADIAMSYEGLNTFVVTVTKRGEDEDPIDLVLRRDSLFSWKLSALRLPL
jgi:hypothetical protein